MPDAELNGVKLKRKTENVVIQMLIDDTESENSDETNKLIEFIEIGLDINGLLNLMGF